ncbi:MAG: putative toxin-antitoxin system toxin component, PIN family [Opitutaceae bacterium]|nr:putative toxin-antitoxin system toxin component, PIN family [Opitutaceae bacterium]
MKPRWVLDTNVLISAALTHSGACDLILQAIADGQVVAAWDYPLLAEYREVLARPRFGFSRPVQAEILAFFDLDGHTPAASPVPSLPDPHDEPFLAVALATPDRVLVTGNTKHYPPASRSGVAVLTPREALARLG